MTLAEGRPDDEPERPAFTNATRRQRRREQHPRLGIGSILSGGVATDAQHPGGMGRPGRQLHGSLARDAASDPVVYGLDTGMATTTSERDDLPHNIGIGATRDPKRSCSKAGDRGRDRARAAVDSHRASASHAHPLGRTYESYGEDPALVG